MRAMVLGIRSRFVLTLILLAVAAAWSLPQAGAEENGKKKIVFVAGNKSHGYASHAHYAGCMLLAKAINENVPSATTAVVRDGWPKDASVFDHADTVAIFSDGGGGQPTVAHLDALEKLMKQKVGLACLHYAVEVPKGKPGDALLGAIGGYFEIYWSVNPWWKAEFKTFPDHPVARGVRPFAINDEWYYHMRFVENMAGVTPILTAVPPDSTRQRRDGPHENNPTVRARKGMPEHVAWTYQRPDGGRGFGFTGGHIHWNWGCDSFRTVVLNGIAWTAGVEVPAGGVPSKTPTVEDLLANQDYPPPANFQPKQIEDMLKRFKEDVPAK